MVVIIIIFINKMTTCGWEHGLKASEEQHWPRDTEGAGCALKDLGSGPSFLIFLLFP